MKLTVSLEHRFHKAKDGTIWTKTAFPYSFWRRYLEVFSEVHIVARTQSVDSVPTTFLRVDGENVKIVSLPFYLGPMQYLQKVRQLNETIADSLKISDAILMRVPSAIASNICGALPANYPYGLEVVGDPYDVFASGSVVHPLRRFFQWWFVNQLKKQCASASAISYVTEHTLQKRYRPQESAFTTHYSSIELRDDAFASKSRGFEKQLNPLKLVFVGLLDQLYKAPDILISAVSLLVSKKLDVQLTIVGDGKYRNKLEQQIRDLGLENAIHFTGTLPTGNAIRTQLDNAHIFVLPSRQEGLPRAMIEAMARGLPCIGSNVGGIPELLPIEDMIPPDDANALANKILEVCKDSERMTNMSTRNFEEAKNYHENVLRLRRNHFYTYLKQQTEEWRKARQS